jgi:phosphate acetyltransferase
VILIIDREVLMDDIPRIEKVMDRIASHLDVDTLKEELLSGHVSLDPPRLSPPVFMHQLVERAGKAGKRIVLPEGNDPFVVRAAIKCQDRGIAQCIFLGDPDELERLARAQGIDFLPDG